MNNRYVYSDCLDFTRQYAQDSSQSVFKEAANVAVENHMEHDFVKLLKEAYTTNPEAVKKTMSFKLYNQFDSIRSWTHSKMISRFSRINWELLAKIQK